MNWEGTLAVEFGYHCLRTLQMGLSPLVMLLAADFKRWGGAESGATPPGCLGSLFAIPLSSQQ